MVRFPALRLGPLLFGEMSEGAQRSFVVRITTRRDRESHVFDHNPPFNFDAEVDDERKISQGEMGESVGL